MSTLLRLAVIARLVARPLPLEGSPLGKHIKKGGKGKVGGELTIIHLTWSRYRNSCVERKQPVGMVAWAESVLRRGCGDVWDHAPPVRMANGSIHLSILRFR